MSLSNYNIERRILMLNWKLKKWIIILSKSSYYNLGLKYSIEEAKSVKVPNEHATIANTIKPPICAIGIIADNISAAKPIFDKASSRIGCPTLLIVLMVLMVWRRAILGTSCPLLPPWPLKLLKPLKPLISLGFLIIWFKWVKKQKRKY